jgi:hypothetical protein
MDDREAHVIHAPGPRLVRRSPLRFVRERGAGAMRRPVNASVDLVSLLDVLLAAVLFLLQAFSTTCPGPDPRLPLVQNGDDFIDAPFVSVKEWTILVDGVSAGSPYDLLHGGRLTELPLLGRALAEKRAVWKRVQPNRPFPGVCVFEVGRDVPALVVKSVIATAVHAGYPNTSFLVRTLPDSP